MPKRVPYPYGSINPPRYGSVAFGFNSVAEGAEAFSKYGIRYAYGRMGNPSIEPFELWFADFEKVTPGSVWATRTGMTAVELVVFGGTRKDLGRGKRVVASPYLYGGTYHLLEFYHRNDLIDVTWIENPSDLSSVEKALATGDPAACTLLESPANPTIDIYDIEEIAKLVHKHGSRLVVDNTLGVGLQWPISLGADCAIYSVTKALDRTSSELGGAVVVSPEFRKEVETVFDDLFVHTGMIMDSDAAIMAHKHRTTLERDMQLFSENALKIAMFLEQHPRVKKVNYPFLSSSPYFKLAQKQMPNGSGGILSFELESFEAAVHFVESQQEAILAVHLGDGNEYLVTHPASTTHSKLLREQLEELHITRELIRMSVSLGKTDKIIEDFDRVLASL